MDCVFHSLVLSRIEYALPVWGGYLNAELTGQILSCTGVSSMDSAMLFAVVEQLLEKSDQKMFSAIQHPEHCIHTLLSASTD